VKLILRVVENSLQGLPSYKSSTPRQTDRWKAVEKSLRKLLDCCSAILEHNGRLKRTLIWPDGSILEEEFIGICTPMNAIFKASDVASARVLTKDGDATYGVLLSRRENCGKDVEHYSKLATRRGLESIY